MAGVDCGCSVWSGSTLRTSPSCASARTWAAVSDAEKPFVVREYWWVGVTPIASATERCAQREVVGVALDGVRPRVESGPRVDLRAGEPVERAVVGRRRLVLERDEVVAVRRVERHGGLREDRGTGGGSPGDDERHGERAGREGTCRAKPGPPAGRERVSVAGHGCSLLSPTAAGSWIRGARGAQDGTGRSRGVTSSRRWAEP